MGLFSTATPPINTDKTLPNPIMPPTDISNIPLPPSTIDNTDPLSIGIYYHEIDNLPLATYYFSVSASKGHPIGLVLYAISLRHGWGIERNEQEAIRLLLLATDAITHEQGELPNSFGNYADSLSRKQSIASNSQVVLALHELGVSFKQGWGVPKDKFKAAYYFNMAAHLGDTESQIEIGHCYLRGDGVKESKKRAAYWFRKAEQQGARMVQMQWIWKEKYNT